MSYQGGSPSTYVANAVVAKNRFVKFDAATGKVIQATADDQAIGVALDAAAAADDAIPVAMINGADQVEVEAGAAVAVGAAVKSDATGRATSVGTNQQGIAVTAASGAGEFITVLLAKS